jgi:hypothetical protein
VGLHSVRRSRVPTSFPYDIYRCCPSVFGLAYQGKDIEFRFIIEYSNLRDFYRTLGNNNRSVFIGGFFER